MNDLSSYPEHIQRFITKLKLELTKFGIKLISWEMIEDNATINGTLLALSAQGRTEDDILKRWIWEKELKKFKASPEEFAEAEAEECKEAFAEHYRYENEKQRYTAAMKQAYYEVVENLDE